MKDKASVEPTSRFEGFESVPATITIGVGAALCSLRQLFELRPGTVLALDRPIGEPFDLLVEGVLVARVEPVAAEEGVALKVVEVPEDDDGPGI